MTLRKSLLLLLSGSLLLAVPLPAAAQSLSGIRGIVVDKEGAPIPGATITVTNASLGISQGAVSNDKGEFRIAPLPPGDGYSVRVAFPTMTTVVIPVDIAPGRLASVPATLRPSAEITERVRVVGKTEVVNTEDTSTKTTFTKEFIDSLPILGRNYQDVLKLAPGVSDDDGDGNPNIHGARDTDVVTLVDGMSTSDPYDGKVGQELNLDSIQEIEVKTSGSSAEFGRAQGGFVNVLTKSGGNDFEGTFSMHYRSNILDGDGAGIDRPGLHGGLGEQGLRDLSFADYLPFVSVAGPLRRDKAWYFFTAEYIQIQEPVNALTQAFVRGLEEKRVFGKLSWDISTNHKLQFTATIDPQTFTNQGLDSFTEVESGYSLEKGGLNLLLKGTSVFNPNVFLETAVQHFSSSPKFIPTLDADTNGNGILFRDRNENGFIDATERDPGEDFDRDGKFDVFEDIDDDGVKDQGEDEQGDFDGRLTPRGGCEGDLREDLDCDGNIDWFNEDLNGNGFRDPDEEDIDHDDRLDLGIEDRNGDRLLNDRPFVAPDDQILDADNNPISSLYPYGRARPLPRDFDWQEDQKTLRVSGPYPFSTDSERGRVTLRQDLTVFIPDWNGQHDLKFGAKIEREHYNQDTFQRPQVYPGLEPPTGQSFLPTIGVILPSENNVFNEASSTSFGLYVNDLYKPLPNLTVQLGLRFDRESTDSFGYTPFDPREERALFDRLWNLGGGERGKTDTELGNNDGYLSNGYCSDPLFEGLPGSVCQTSDPNDPVLGIEGLSGLKRVASSRLTQHHISTSLVAANLQALYPEAKNAETGEIDREVLRTLGASVFQEEQSFRLTNNNLSPRLAISWDPWADSKTKLFANWSRFYDNLFLNTVVGEEGPDAIYRYYRKDQDGVTGAGVPNNGIGEPLAKAPPSATQVDRGLQTPFSDELTLGFERELAPEVSLKFTYIDRQFRNQLQDLDINHSVRYDEVTGRPLDVIGKFLPSQGGGAASGTRINDNRPDLYVSNFFFNQIYRLGNFNRARYKGIEIQLIKRLSRKWQMDGSYTYSRAVGHAEEFDSALGDDPATRAQEFGYLDYDQRHVVKLNVVTFLPKDWQVGGTLSWSSGLPYTIVSTFVSLDNFDYPANRTLFGEIIRNPDLDSEDEDVVNAARSQEWIFNPIRRNSERNNPIYNIDLRAQKAFVLGRFNSKFFLTVQNLLNTDDLTIETFEPAAPNRGGALQLDSERRFGRRFEVGFQFEF